MLKARLTGQKAPVSKDEQGPQSEAELIACLNHLDGAVREAAIGALGQLEAAAKSKHVAAVVGLLKKSDSKALEWYKRCAERRHVEAEYTLGNLVSLPAVCRRFVLPSALTPAGKPC